MDIDFREICPRDRYKLLVGSIVPRPIALVSTVGLDGRMNAAPFSFFNAVSDDPPAIAVGVNSSVPGRTKDTARNIRDTGEFVVNLVDTALAQRMNVCAVDFPPEVDEFAMAGLTALPGRQVRAPRVGEAPISLECRRLVTVEIGIGRNLVVGEVVHLHIRDDLIDRERLHVHAERSDLIGRMHGLGWYARTTDLFEMPRLAPEEVVPAQPAPAGR
ncbi:MAG: flavin reductase family protein [Alphaproteobacteria bacterium]|nr:flavin reductase family protein [Alphaproteobacteria bacterium]